ncbi:unnamed protein product, partial [marine sediment metagenome]
EDEVGFFEVITFPAVYQKYSNLFRKEAPLLIEGVLNAFLPYLLSYSVPLE